MKKVLSIVMMIAMVLSLSVTVFAEEETGSITITNPTMDKQYSVYKVFDATVGLDSNGYTGAISYSITDDNQFFEPLFGAFGTFENQYFNYNAQTGLVTKKESVADADVVNYLTALINNTAYTFIPDATDTANNETVVFNNLPYGYYVVTSTVGSIVTIDSTTPDVQVIDKNQGPNGFKKEIKVGEDTYGNPIWGDENSANIGDLVTYKVTLNATNYDGEELIYSYKINDFTASAICTDFSSFSIKVNDTVLYKGYYLSECDATVEGLGALGTWGNTTPSIDKAEWYLIHTAENEFYVLIPWLIGHSIEKITDDATGNITYKLNYPEEPQPKFVASVTVVMTYDAAVEPNATLGNNTTNNLNTAYASWTFASGKENKSGEFTVRTKVYAVGIIKNDAVTLEKLAGAEFRLYRDETLKTPVNVIPTDIEGVYMVDSYLGDAEGIAGSNLQTSRKVYESFLLAYLGEDYATAQDSLVTSKRNGKIVIIGLAEGTYYLKEIKAPAGYNPLATATAIEVGKNTTYFEIFADDEGKVANIEAATSVFKSNSYNVTSTTIANNKGVELPSTGGKGTVMLITIGSLIAIGFAVFLITHKKMSVYVD